MNTVLLPFPPAVVGKDVNLGSSGLTPDKSRNRKLEIHMDGYRVYQALVRHEVREKS
jgi:hypothetical protein